MSKFCSKCGEKLETGKSCNCQSEPNSKTTKGSNKGNAFIDNAKTILNDCLKMFINPKAVVEDKKTNGMAWILAMLIQFIAIYVAMLIVSSDGYGVFYLLGLGSLSDLELVMYFKYALVLIIMILVYLFAFVGPIYLVMNKLFKIECSFKEVLNKFSYPSLIMSATILVASLASYINEEVVYYIMVFGLFYFVVITYALIKSYFKLDDNKALQCSPLFITISILAARVIMYHTEIIEKILS